MCVCVTVCVCARANVICLFVKVLQVKQKSASEGFLQVGDVVHSVDNKVCTLQVSI